MLSSEPLQNPGAIKSEIMNAVHLFFMAFVRYRNGSLRFVRLLSGLKSSKFPYYSQDMFSALLGRNKFFNLIRKKDHSNFIVVENCRE